MKSVGSHSDNVNNNQIVKQQHFRTVVYDRSPVSVNRLCDALKSYSSAGLLKAIENKTIDVDGAFAEFNYIINYFVKAFVPQHTVCIRPKDPAFVTPLIKHYLRKRNIALRRGLVEKGAALSKKIKKLINEERNTMLTKASTSNIKQLWLLLKCTDNWGKRLNLLSECGNAEDINKHFASVATDQNYNKDNIITELTRYIYCRK